VANRFYKLVDLDAAAFGLRQAVSQKPQQSRPRLRQKQEASGQASAKGGLALSKAD